MASIQVIDGRVAHGNGSFELKLQGRERAKAHAEIMKLTEPSDRAGNRNESFDLAVREIIRTDPSLLLEPIPDKYPLARKGSEFWVEADTTWSIHVKWYGNWLARMVQPGSDYIHTVQTALEFGIHPDDEAAWPAKRLLCTQDWITTPEKLSMALNHGARPNRGEEWDDAYLRKVLAGIRANLTGNYEQRTEESIINGVRCAELLLDAGATETEPPTVNKHLLTAIGYLVDHGNRPDLLSPRIHTRINELMERLQRSNADIDCRNGVMAMPPVIHAIRCLNIEGACQLIRIGCRTDDAHIVRTSGLGGIINPLMAEAYEAGKEAFTTRIIAAMMQRQMLLSNAKAMEQSSSESGSPVPRKRMAV